MEIIGPKLCPKHNQQAHKICTNPKCFEQKDILVCSMCSSKHINRHCVVIDVHLLNEKVHELMKKKVDFQMNYHQAVEGLLTQYKKFKLFKQEIFNILNDRQRFLNDLCRKIKRTIPYEKDKHLFKQNFSYLYLSTKANNPNFDLYSKFKQVMTETINNCKSTIHKLVKSENQVQMMIKKQHQICAIVKRLDQPSVLSLNYSEPKFNGFKKQTINFSQKVQKQIQDSKLVRIDDQQFLAYSDRSNVVRWYNARHRGLPKIMHIGEGIDNLEILDRNLFLTNYQNCRIYIYDLLNDKLLKQYTSSKHKTAKINSLLSLDHQHILNFITHPNQIVSLSFKQDQGLKMVKGIQVKYRCRSAEKIGEQQFVSLFDDNVVRIYRNQTLQRDIEYPFESAINCMSVQDHHTFVLGDESGRISLTDKRTQGIVSSYGVGGIPLHIKKIYPTSLLINAGSAIKIYDYRIQKQLLSLEMGDSRVYDMEVLNSGTFVTSGRHICFYDGV